MFEMEEVGLVLTIVFAGLATLAVFVLASG